MTNDAFIEKLSQDLKPVRPFRPATFRLTLTTLVAAVVTVSGGLNLGYFQMRNDLHSVAGQPFFWSELGLPLLAFFASVILVDFLSIPGRVLASTQVKWVRWVWIFFGLFISVEGMRSLQYDWSLIMAGAHPAGLTCVNSVILLALVPSATLFILAKRRAVTEPRTAGMVVALTGIAVGLVGVGLHCLSTHAVHILLWHLAVPILLASVTGFVALARAFRW